jgi:hypothetical protein
MYRSLIILITLFLLLFTLQVKYKLLGDLELRMEDGSEFHQTLEY